MIFSCKPLKKIEDIYPKDKTEPNLIVGNSNIPIAWEDSLQALDDQNNASENILYNISFDLDHKMADTNILPDYSNKKSIDLAPLLQSIEDLKASSKNKPEASKTH